VALRTARDGLRAGQARACVVAGADSYLDLDTLEWLEDTDQVHGAGRSNNAWGFIPGEGAGAVLLVREEVAQQARMKVVGRLLGVGAAVEGARIRTDTVCVGRGLSDAFLGALSVLPNGERVSDVYCDMNGEPYRAAEFGLAILRVRKRFVSPSDFVAPADCWGDVGAASGPLGVVLACIAMAKGYARGSSALVWASSESGERGAATLVSGDR
jgi:3-oxoacyl-[acyl-carrier-protein] synthase-1